MLNHPESWNSQAKRIVNDCTKFIDERNMFCHGALREATGTISGISSDELYSQARKHLLIWHCRVLVGRRAPASAA
jgi:hypothetical protein